MRVLAKLTGFFRGLAEPEITKDDRVSAFKAYNSEAEKNLKLLDTELEELYNARDALKKAAGSN